MQLDFCQMATNYGVSGKLLRIRFTNFPKILGQLSLDVEEFLPLAKVKVDVLARFGECH